MSIIHPFSFGNVLLHITSIFKTLELINNIQILEIYSDTPGAVLAEEQLYITQFTPGVKQTNIRIIKLRCISAPRSWSNIKNTLVSTILTSRHIQCLHMMYAEVAWVLVSSRTQVQLQIILNPDYFQVSSGLS